MASGTHKARTRIRALWQTAYVLVQPDTLTSAAGDVVLFDVIELRRLVCRLAAICEDAFAAELLESAAAA